MFPMFLLNIVVVLLIVGLLLWAIGQFPLDPTIAKVIRVCVIVIVCIWLIYTLAEMAGPYPIWRRP